MLVESVLVNTFKQMGVLLTNQTSTLGRQEKPPLEIFRA